MAEVRAQGPARFIHIKPKPSVANFLLEVPCFELVRRSPLSVWSVSHFPHFLSAILAEFRMRHRSHCQGRRGIQLPFYYETSQIVSWSLLFVKCRNFPQFFLLVPFNLSLHFLFFPSVFEVASNPSWFMYIQ